MSERSHRWRQKSGRPWNRASKRTLSRCFVRWSRTCSRCAAGAQRWQPSLKAPSSLTGSPEWCRWCWWSCECCRWTSCILSWQGTWSSVSTRCTQPWPSCAWLRPGGKCHQSRRHQHQGWVELTAFQVYFGTLGWHHKSMPGWSTQNKNHSPRGWCLLVYSAA